MDMDIQTAKGLFFLIALGISATAFLIGYALKRNDEKRLGIPDIVPFISGAAGWLISFILLLTLVNWLVSKLPPAG